MANILIPGQDPVFDSSLDSDLDLTQFLSKDNYLGEFDEEFEKEIVRSNLGVPKTEDVYTKTDSDNRMSTISNNKMNEHLKSEDPHSILPIVNEIIKEYVKTDGTTPFTAPQTGINPINDFHLTTKKFVTQLLQAHLNSVDPHGAASLITAALTEYVKASSVFTKTETYSRSQVDGLLNTFVKRDGTKSFTAPQQGVHPSGDYDLATKKYIDDLVYGYIADSDLDNFKLFVNNALNAKARASEVYKKSETYSKVQLDLIVSQLVNSAAQEALSDHIQNTYHLTVSDLETYLSKYVLKSDLEQLTSETSELSRVATTLSSISTFGTGASTTGDCCFYIPHGPTLSPDVGFVETGRDLPNPISYQDLFDIIFYDSQVSITVDPNLIEGGVSTEICATMKISGITAVDYVELYLNDVLYNSYDFDTEFVDGELVVCGINISETTEFKMVVYYKSGDIKEATDWVYAIAPIYVGLLPKWYFGSNITYEFLQKLVNGDLIDATNFNIPIYGDSDNNKKLIQLVEPGNIEIHYKFEYDGVARHPFIMYPKNSQPSATTTAKLYEMTTPSQQFSTVDYLTDLTIILPNGTSEVYEVFIYSPAVTSLDTDVTYKFQ